jgi:hypothetical protein
MQSITLGYLAWRLSRSDGFRDRFGANSPNLWNPECDFGIDYDGVAQPKWVHPTRYSIGVELDLVEKGPHRLSPNELPGHNFHQGQVFIKTYIVLELLEFNHELVIRTTDLRSEVSERITHTLTLSHSLDEWPDMLEGDATDSIFAQEASLDEFRPRNFITSSRRESYDRRVSNALHDGAVDPASKFVRLEFEETSRFAE